MGLELLVPPCQQLLIIGGKMSEMSVGIIVFPRQGKDNNNNNKKNLHNLLVPCCVV